MRGLPINRVSRNQSWALRKAVLAVTTALATLVLVCTPKPATAWGADGHRLVAEVAQSRLTPRALAEVTRLLAQEPGATMASVSTWADEVRSRSTAGWHYVNFPRDSCIYDAQRDCKAGGCVVSAIDEQLSILRESRDDTARLTALKWLIHLVADVHQPLHAGYAEDRGGNLWQIQAFGRGTNLHALWDTGLLTKRPGGLEQLQREVQSAADTARPPRASGPAVWAMESCRAVAESGFYPDSRAVGLEYASAQDEQLIARLAASAQRLAQVLNVAFGRNSEDKRR